MSRAFYFWALGWVSVLLVACGGDPLPNEQGSAQAGAAAAQKAPLDPLNRPGADKPKTPLTPELRAALIRSRQAEGGQDYAVIKTPIVDSRTPSARFHSQNKAQHFVAGFASRHVGLSPSEGLWNAEIETTRYGCSSDLRKMPAAALSGDPDLPNRIEYRRGAGVTEWYVNGPLGLEQGYTIARRPPCRTGRTAKAHSQNLVVEVEVRGLSPSMVDGGTTIALRDQEGEVRARYSDLFVSDAKNQVLAASLAISDGRILLRIDDSNATYPIEIDPLVAVQQAELFAVDSGDGFGAKAVDVSGDVAIVGSPYDDDKGNVAGSAYIFVRTLGIWKLQAKLYAADAQEGDYFGISAAIDGNRAAIGAYGDDDKGTSAGAVYVFERSGTTWTQAAKLFGGAGTYDALGDAVDVSGNYIIAAAPFEDGAYYGTGAVYIFFWDGAAWITDGFLYSEVTTEYNEDEPWYGDSVSISDGATVRAAVGMGAKPDVGGAVYLYHKPGKWEEQRILTAADAKDGDWFGTSVSLSTNDRLLVGAPHKNGETGAAYVFDYTCIGASCDWFEQTQLTASDGTTLDNFGWDVALDGDLAVVGAPYDSDDVFYGGSAYVFMHESGTWSERAKLTAGDTGQDDQFGWVVAADASTSTALIGAPNHDDPAPDAGAAYAYYVGEKSGLEAKLSPNDAALSDSYGWGLDIDGDTAIVGSYFDDDRNIANRGSAYVYARSGGIWKLQSKLLASDGAAGDSFGRWVAVSGNYAVVGAYQADRDAAMLNSGKAYVYYRSGATWYQQVILQAGDPTTNANFGSGVDISGDTISVGASGTATPGAVYIFLRTGTGFGTWAQQAKLVPTGGVAGERFGWSTSLQGNMLAVGAYAASASGLANVGAAYVFSRTGTAWTQLARMQPIVTDQKSNANMGYDIGLSNSTVVVGAYGDSTLGSLSGAAFVFTGSGSSWAQQAKLTASNTTGGDYFGVDVAIAGDIIISGAYRADRSGLTDSGAAYVFTRSGTTWTQNSELNPADRQSSDLFGFGVAISGDTVVGGASQHDHLTGMGRVGSVYAFLLRQSNGDSCPGAFPCASGNCIDGVCCNSACGNGVATDCIACNVNATTRGLCSVAASTHTCRAASGDCDVADTCNGTATTCPVDQVKAANTACPTDNNACTVDQCNGTSKLCQHPAGNAGVMCRDNAGACDLREYCTGTSTACPADGFQSSNNVCRNSAGDCDVPESCPGNGPACPGDAKKSAGTACTSDNNNCTVDTCNGTSNACQYTAGNGGTVCRAAAGECDQAETCSGTSTLCPNDAVKPANTACTTDNNPCTVDQCNGQSTLCQYTAGNAGSQCRAANGECDVAENCTGTSASCPTDGFKALNTGCNDDGLTCTRDVCPGNSGTCSHPAGNAGIQCRAASGTCDVPEACDGMSIQCPADALAGSTVTCRAATSGGCDVAEKCSGSSASCPPDSFLSSTTQCRAASCNTTTNIATLSANCTGSGANCPTVQTVDCAPNTCNGTSCAGGCTTDGTCAAGNYCSGGVCTPKKGNGNTCSATNECISGNCVDGVCCNSTCGGGAANDCQACNVAGSVGSCSAAPSTIVCRASGGECDTEEKCTGTSTTCPSDAKKSNGTACTSDGNPCTVDQCNGSAVSCQYTVGNAGTVCRGANGACDVAETCTGASATCPGDGFAAVTVECRASLGECDVAENCTGTSAACPGDGKKGSGTSCSSDNNPCTVDQCNGTAVTCQYTAGNPGTTCRAAADDCDVAEACSGTSVNCPANGYKSVGTVCRSSAGECDLAETCSGSSASCPSNGFKAAGSACTSNDGNPCTADQCNGSSAACQQPAGNAGTVCRPATGECDTAESCTGTTTACPSDAFKTEGTACTSDNNPCTVDECNGNGATCPHPAGNSGTICRAAADECDLDETCTGTATTCPTDRVKPTGTLCSDDGNPCSTDQCNGVLTTCQHPAGNPGTTCRAAAGSCDVAETCSGTSTSCPSDGKVGAGTVCRAPTGDCDVAESCSGTSNSCPNDAYQSSAFECRAASCDSSVHVATLAANCTGTGPSCPIETVPCAPYVCSGTSCAGGCTTDAECTSGACAGGVCYCSSGICVSKKPNGATCSGNSQCTGGNCVDGVCCDTSCGGGLQTDCQACNVAGYEGTCSPAPSTVICRSASGECDQAESCTGSSTTCPADIRRANGSSCTDDGNVCTSDICDGTNVACQHPAGNSGVTCRGANGVCDAEEKCTGTSATCPADIFKTNATTCRASAGECDPAERCSGTSASCPADGLTASGTACSSDSNPCTADQCNGTSAACQHPAGNAGTACRAAAGVCDSEERCTGTSTVCPTDVFLGTSTTCRASAGECDVSETCNGSSVSCPVDGFKAAATACTTDSNPCTLDQCSGAAAACQHPAGNAGTTCRASADECDVAETCTGTATACPGDGFKAAGTACSTDNNVCTEDKCNGGSPVCQHPAGNAGEVCRNASSECDVAETCTGTTTACPTDTFQSAGAPCTADSEACTADQCDGIGACKHPAGNAGVVCRTATSDCDTVETCDGSVGTCPTDAFKPVGSECATDGNPCTLDQCGATGACTHPAGNAGSVCRDAVDACDVAETCSGTSTSCATNAFKADGTACKDADVCNGSESCRAGTCSPGTALNCNDANDCTTDNCHPATGCANTAVADNTVCDDNSTCSSGDRCVSGVCQGTSGLNCDDSNTCTSDSCGGSPLACTNTMLADNTPCNDADACSQVDLCADGTCVGTQPLNCDDGNVCTSDTCDPAIGCDNRALPNGADCDDGNPCNGTETCQGGLCKAGTAPNCNDGDPCTADTCQIGTGCRNIALSNGTSCSDGDVCNGNETCQTGACVRGAALSCNDNNPCTVDSCDPTTGGCVNNPVSDGIGCADDDVCDGTETCQAGACVAGTAPNCDDADTCTLDLCDPAVGCISVAADNGTSCNDDDVCTRADSCQAGTCTGTSPIVCNDGNPCTDDACDGDVGCKFTAKANGATCDDGNPCSSGDQCQAGACIGTSGVICNDNNPCTVDSCDIATQTCTFTRATDGTACDDRNLCTVGDTCIAGACAAGDSLNCGDANVCTNDTCSAGSGCVRTANEGAPCSDGDPCTLNDRCLGMACTPVDPVLCVAKDECHSAGACDGFTGVCSDPSVADGSVCQGTGTCESGSCVISGTGGTAGAGGMTGTAGTAGAVNVAGAAGTGTSTGGGGGVATTGGAGGGPGSGGSSGMQSDAGADAGDDSFSFELKGCACRSVGKSGSSSGGSSNAAFGILFVLAGAALRRRALGKKSSRRAS